MDGRGNMTARLSECMCKTARMAEIVRGMHVQCFKGWNACEYARNLMGMND